MSIYDFAYCPNMDAKLRTLAFLCPEKWSFDGERENGILRNYIFHTFLKLQEENKVIEGDGYALFNTGLFDAHYSPIYAHFRPNRNTDKQKWVLDGFYNEYQLALMHVSEPYPKRADYFQRPEDLLFNTNLNIVAQYNHIFNDPENYNRLPDSVKTQNVRALFDGAVMQVRHMIDANYKTAVPQYYRNRIQLLLPLFMEGNETPTAALVVSKDDSGKQYLGHTVLTLNMAYNNARLIARPDSVWLKP